MSNRYGKYLLFGVIIASVSALMLPDKDRTKPARDYPDIADEGILRVTMAYGANSYHVNAEGGIEGFHYRLVKQFAEEHGLTLEVVPEMEATAQDSLMAGGICDLIADGRLLTDDYDTTRTRFTIPVTKDRLVLVQRSDEGDSLCPRLRSQIELAGQTVCIPKGSPFKQRIAHIMEEIGDSIHIREIPRYGQEQLMAMVAHGDICYAVCEEDVVNTHASRFPQLDTRLPIGFNQFYAWVTRAESVALADSLNAWLERKGFRLKP